MAKGRICVTCGCTYQYCPNCLQDAKKPTWMFAFCSEPCKVVYDVITDYEAERISKDEAAERLQSINARSYSFTRGVMNVIDTIMEIEDTRDRTLDSSIDKELSSEDIADPIVEGEIELEVAPVVPKTRKSRKKSNS